jgi:hypothetical protein
VTICPCCGFKFHGALTDGCDNCGARAVGVALPKPAHQLPSYGRSLVLVVGGSLTLLVFLIQTIIALFQKGFASFGFWSVVAAGETAAWRLKWIAIPVTLVTLWLGRKLYRSIKQQPDRFCGVTYARRGLLASVAVSFLIALLIGVTVPARLRQREMSAEAAKNALVNTFDLAVFRYQLIHKRTPYQSTVKEELSTLTDPDGSIAAALAVIDLQGYQPIGEVAAVASEKSRSLRGAAIRTASFNSSTDDSTPAGLPFTHYELRLAGDDKVFGTDDDWVMRDGVIKKAIDVAQGGLGKTAGTLRP